MSKAMYLFLNPEGCWHEAKWNPSTVEILCRHCGEKRFTAKKNPDYTDWKYFGPWWEKFGKHEARKDFSLFAVEKWPAPKGNIFLFWLLQSPAHFCSLFSEWLSLPEVQERWGWTEPCPNFSPNPEDINCLNWSETCSCLSGKVKAPWLVAKEEG